MHVHQDLIALFHFYQHQITEKGRMGLPQRKSPVGLDGGMGVDLWLAPSALACTILVCQRGAGHSGARGGARDAVTGEGVPGCAVASPILSVIKFHLDTSRRDLFTHMPVSCRPQTNPFRSQCIGCHLELGESNWLKRELAPASFGEIWCVSPHFHCRISAAVASCDRSDIMERGWGGWN